MSMKEKFMGRDQRPTLNNYLLRSTISALRQCRTQKCALVPGTVENQRARRMAAANRLTKEAVVRAVARA